MSFEVNTLFLLTIDVEAILGLLLLLVWVQNARVTAVAWWASAHLMRATSVMLYGLYGSVPCQSGWLMIPTRKPWASRARPTIAIPKLGWST